MSSGARSSACWRQATEKGRSMLALSAQSSITSSQHGFAADAGPEPSESITNAANRRAAPKAACRPADDPSLSHTVVSCGLGQQAITVSAHFEGLFDAGTRFRACRGSLTRRSHGDHTAMSAPHAWEERGPWTGVYASLTPMPSASPSVRRCGAGRCQSCESRYVGTSQTAGTRRARYRTRRSAAASDRRRGAVRS